MEWYTFHSGSLIAVLPKVWYDFPGCAKIKTNIPMTVGNAIIIPHSITHLLWLIRCVTALHRSFSNRLTALRSSKSSTTTHCTQDPKITDSWRLTKSTIGDVGEGESHRIIHGYLHGYREDASLNRFHGTVCCVLVGEHHPFW